MIQMTTWQVPNKVWKTIILEQGTKRYNDYVWKKNEAESFNTESTMYSIFVT